MYICVLCGHVTETPPHQTQSGDIITKLTNTSAEVYSSYQELPSAIPEGCRLSKLAVSQLVSNS